MFFAGIDVGSRTTKAVILNRDKKIIAFEITATGVHGQKAAQRALDGGLEKGDLRPSDLVSIVSTGYGKKSVPSVSAEVTEITCHARGAYFLNPATRTVLDIGGQDSKAILLDGSGRVLDFAMNDRCAAGTGRFLEFMARVVERNLDRMSTTPHDPSRTREINSLCTVFAESEVISFLAEGVPVEDIIRGLHGSVAERMDALLHRISFVAPIALTGGVAKNSGVVAALKQRIKVSFTIPEEPQIVGAVGAALTAYSKADKALKETIRSPSPSGRGS